MRSILNFIDVGSKVCLRNEFNASGFEPIGFVTAIVCRDTVVVRWNETGERSIVERKKLRAIPIH